MHTVTAAQFLNVFPVFQKSPKELVEGILSSGRPVAFKSKAVLYSEGDGCQGIGFLMSGEIRVFKAGVRGREITLYEIFPGETCILNASCILAGRSYPANAAALSDGEALFIPEAVFRRLISEHDDLRKFIFRLFSSRMASIVELIDEVVFAKMDDRLENYLLEKSENDRLYFSHQTIADDLGTSREVVSRLLKDFEKKGKVRLGRNLIEILSLPPV
jgi:CRP/FNR family transcriptional regulator